MKLMIILFLISFNLFAGTWPNNDYTLGDGSATTDKGFTFDTGDAGSNVFLKVDDTKKIKFSGNSFQMGDGASANNKEFIFDSTSGTSLKWNGSTNGVELNNSIIKLGDGVAANVDIELNNGTNHKIRSNPTSGKIEFTHDGSLFKTIGSGAGGGATGENYLLNGNSEDGTGSWLTSGGTLTSQSYTNSTESNLKYLRYASTVAAQYFYQTITIPDNAPAGCMADFKYYQGDTAFDYEVIEDIAGTPLILATGSVSDLTSWQKAPTHTFDCPAGGISLTLRIISIAAGTIDFDDAYLGSNKNITPVGISSHNVGYIELDSGNVSTLTSGSYVTSISTAQVGTIYGDVEFPTGNKLGVSVPLLKKGRYRIKVSGFTLANGSATNGYWSAISVGSDDITSTQNCGVFKTGSGVTGSASAVGGADLSCIYEAATDLIDKEFYLKQRSNASSSSVEINDGAAISIDRISTASETQEALTPGQADFFVSANIGGGTPSGESAGVPTDAGLDMVLKEGSANITCNDNSQGALTCSTGSEQLGIEVNIPRAGRYEACWQSIGTASTSGNMYLRIGHYQNLSNTQISLGDEITGVRSDETLPTYSHLSVCGTFNINSVGINTFKVYTESSDLTSAAFQLNGGVTSNLRDGNWKIKMAGHNVSQTILQNMITTSIGAGMRIESCDIINNGTATINNVSGLCGWITSVNRSAAADVDITVNTGIFSNPPACVCSGAEETTFQAICGVRRDTLTTTFIPVRMTDNDAGKSDGDFNITCTGRR